MQDNYSPKDIEQQARQAWLDQDIDSTTTDTDKPTYYCLSMFPYTSGELHMGHVRNYAIGDAISRYKRMQGFEVLQPMGWDSFGLPAENAAIKNKSHPAKWTRDNIKTMRNQLKSLGFMYDWQREFATCDKEYYRWQQWLFLQMVKEGIAYRKEAVVNWDPVDQTVLANEQVVNGCGWRSGAKVERKSIQQWFLKISDYAPRLLGSLDDLTQWPEQVKIMQRNWIGQSKGSNIRFYTTNDNTLIETFSTRIDTLYGASFLALSPEHPLITKLASENKDIAKFVAQCQQQTTQEADIATVDKQGLATGIYVKNPLTNTEIPVWVANYVLMDYGSGAVMCVPAHDERDREFAEKYQLPIIQVITQIDEQEQLINSEEMNGLSPEAARKAITEKLEKQGLAEFTTTYRLRDWGISRQRYWGVPIPMVYCDKCGIVPEKESSLPVTLPEDIAYEYGKPLLKEHSDFYHTKCPVCGGPAHRETDTFDTFFDSSWYYHYFISSSDQTMTTKANDKWLPVDHYIGGIEHAILHLLYARFIQKVLKDLNLSQHEEPFKALLSQGMVLKDGAKMSKSKGNVVQPLQLIEKYGADTVRLFMLFASPPEQSLEWSDGGVDGAHRFLKKVWSFKQQHDFVANPHVDWTKLNSHDQNVLLTIHTILAQVIRDIEKNQFNTVVSAAMKIFKALATAQDQQVLSHGYQILLQILAPITPHISFVLWQDLGFGSNIFDSSFPQPSQEILQKQQQINYVVQFNGKTKGQLSFKPSATSDDLLAAIAQDNKLNKWLNGTPKKTIVVPNKLVNIVLG